MITHARVRIMRVHAIISYTSAYLSVVFEGSFLEAPRAVLFHATAIHCHYGIDIEDASFLVLERELLIFPQLKVLFSQKRSKNGRAS